MRVSEIPYNRVARLPVSTEIDFEQHSCSELFEPCTVLKEIMHILKCSGYEKNSHNYAIIGILRKIS